MTYHYEQSATEVHHYLLALQAERSLASIDGFSTDSAYLAYLDDEIAATNSAFVGAAVTEIATFRAELSGPQVG
jgi:hypothetical protein